MPRALAASVEELVLHLLWVDLEAYSTRGSGQVKKRLAKAQLQEAAQAWIDFHPSDLHEEDRRQLRNCGTYPELWNTFKRLVLNECGLHVVAARSQRIYFAAPHHRPNALAGDEKKGTWHERVTAPHAYLRLPQDEERAQDAGRPRSYVRNATSEQSMGAGALPEFEVPLPEDDDALECADKHTKVEWDAIRLAEHWVKIEALGNALRPAASACRHVAPSRARARFPSSRPLPGRWDDGEAL